MDTVLVTGAAGTVGNYVVSLAEAAGLRVIATDLNAAGLRTPVRGEIRTGNLENAGFVRRVVEGCDAVIHTAAQMDVAAEPASLARTNTDVVSHLYEAAAEVGASRFIHLSTAMLYGTGQPMPLTEESPIDARGAHGLSKHGAEVYLRSQASGPAWTILRPAPIYGRRGRHFAASLLVIGPMLRLTWPVLPRLRGGPHATMAHAEDVAHAAIFALQHDATAGQVYNVSDGDPLPIGERITETFRLYGLPTFPTVELAPWLLRSIATVFRAPPAYAAADVAALSAWRVAVLRYGLKPALRPRLDQEALTLLEEDLVVDASKLRALGWSPRHPSFEEGWREVLRWYQAERWVPRFA